MSTVKYIVSNGYTMVGNTGAPSSVLSPGQRVTYNDELPSHKQIASDIASGVNETLEIVEIDPEAEKRAAEEQKAMLEQAERIAAEARAEEDAAARKAAGEGIYNPEENHVADVLEYLETASPEEVARVQELEAASSRKSIKIADFEPYEPADEGEGV